MAMSNNYDDGYQAGLRGEQAPGSGAQGIAGYMAGQAARAQNVPHDHQVVPRGGGRRAPVGVGRVFLGFAVEKRLARGKVYRVLRDCYRIALGAAIPISMLMTTGRNTPSGGAIFFSIVTLPTGYWIVKRIDRAVGAGGAA